MFFSKPALFSSVVLAALVSISGWFVIKSLEQQIRKEKLPQDFIINKAKDLHYNRINDQGELAYSALAKSATRYVNEDALLHQVDVVFYNKGQTEAPWHITSNYAKTTNKNDKIRLYGKVVMEKKRQNHALPEVRVTTEQVLYDSPSDTLNTDDLVTIVEPGTDNITTGIGLLGYPKQGNFSLLSDVRSYYAGRK